ncbi:GntR family transcriptional regulator [Ureibacillus sp. 179-F W5.1 NHS]|uniref:GntR family transcriptional regulator n=1 Tax=Ureibacillus sp. 179-F W5.1 NHS TaxID=3374297 RepID=UPI00387A7B77
MNLKQESNTPIYIQIAEWIENEIIADQLLENGKVFSQYQLAEMFNINPATAGKGLAILLENGILYKKRGLGMFVQENAKELILSRRRNEKLSKLAIEIVEEAKRLLVSDSELIELIKKIQRGEG